MFVRGKGNIGATYYDAWNGLTECFTHGIGAGKNANAEGKFLASQFGTAADIKEGYLPFLLQSQDVIAAELEHAKKLVSEYVTAKSK